MAIHLVFLLMSFYAFDSQPGHYINNHSHAYVELEGVLPMKSLESLRVIQAAYAIHRGEVLEWYMSLLDTPIRQESIRQSITGIVRLSDAEVRAALNSGESLYSVMEMKNKRDLYFQNKSSTGSLSVCTLRQPMSCAPISPTPSSTAPQRHARSSCELKPGGSGRADDARRSERCRTQSKYSTW
jgi:hypothetical protein